jgi:hypothetical protein
MSEIAMFRQLTKGYTYLRNLGGEQCLPLCNEQLCV